MINLEVQIPDLKEIKKTAMNRAKKEALKASLTHIKNERLMNRFLYSGTQASLGYKSREAKYQATKRKRFPAARGLAHVLTGATKRAFELATVVSQVVRGSINVTGLHAGYGRIRRPKRINMIAEITRLSPADQKAMTEVYEKTLLDAINAELNKKTNRKKLKQTS